MLCHAVCTAAFATVIASEALVLLSTWWHTYGTMRIARASNQDVSMTYLLLRDGEPPFLRLMLGLLIP